jgi:predicted HTH domain antitoxin
MKLAFELELPDGAVDKASEAQLVRSVKEQTVLKLYSEDRVTTGEAAELLGLPRIAFLDLLRSSGVGYNGELDEDDFKTLRRRLADHADSKTR